MVNVRLRTAMAAAQVTVETVAQTAGVDPRTVHRWLGGRVPHPRHRWAVANLLDEEEGHLWPSARPGLDARAEATGEVVAAYGHRADIPISRWRALLAAADRQISLLGYAHLFLPEQHVDLVELIKGRCAAGCQVRIMFADPNGSRVKERDSLERLGGTLPARIRMSLAYLEDLQGLPGVQMRFHDVHLYHAIYRFDDELIVTPHLHAAHGPQHPALHLRRLTPDGIFASFAEQLERVWEQASPLEDSGPS